MCKVGENLRVLFKLRLGSFHRHLRKIKDDYNKH